MLTRAEIEHVHSIPGERWAWIPGYANTYRISSLGRVYSSPRPTTRGGILAGSIDGHGYPRVSLVQNGRQTTRRVHVLVSLAFRGPTPRGLEIRHLDGDPANAALSNLAFGTHAENMRDMVRHGRSTTSAVCKRGHVREGENLGARGRTSGSPCLACRREAHRALQG